MEVVKGEPLDFPTHRTRKPWITMGFDEDLNRAWAQAKAQTVKFLAGAARRVYRPGGEIHGERLRLPCLAGRHIKKGIHCLNPKNTRDKEDMERPTKETPKYYVSMPRMPT